MPASSSLVYEDIGHSHRYLSLNTIPSIWSHELRHYLQGQPPGPLGHLIVRTYATLPDPSTGLLLVASTLKLAWLAFEPVLRSL